VLRSGSMIVSGEVPSYRKLAAGISIRRLVAILRCINMVRV